MREKLYFVILYYPNGKICPLMKDNNDMQMFESDIDATIAGNDSNLGLCHDDFEVFELGGGI